MRPIESHDEQERSFAADLATDYIDHVAAEASRALRLGRPYVVAYEPGDMTRYVLVFTPLDISPTTERSYLRRGLVRYGESGLDVVELAEPYETGLGIDGWDGSWALVSLVDYGAHPFKLSGFSTADYVAEKLGISSRASAVAIAELLRRVKVK